MSTACDQLALFEEAKEPEPAPSEPPAWLWRGFLYGSRGETLAVYNKAVEGQAIRACRKLLRQTLGLYAYRVERMDFPIDKV